MAGKSNKGRNRGKGSNAANSVELATELAAAPGSLNEKSGAMESFKAEANGVEKSDAAIEASEPADAKPKAATVCRGGNGWEIQQRKKQRERVECGEFPSPATLFSVSDVAAALPPAQLQPAPSLSASPVTAPPSPARPSPATLFSVSDAAAALPPQQAAYRAQTTRLPNNSVQLRKKTVRFTPAS